MVIVFSDTVLERFSLLLHLLSLLALTKKGLVTLDKWECRKVITLRSPEQSGHYVFVEGAILSPIFPEVASTGYF